MTLVGRVRDDLEALERMTYRLEWIGEDYYDGEGAPIGRAIDSALKGLETLEITVRGELAALESGLVSSARRQRELELEEYGP